MRCGANCRWYVMLPLAEPSRSLQPSNAYCISHLWLSYLSNLLGESLPLSSLEVIWSLMLTLLIPALCRQQLHSRKPRAMRLLGMVHMRITDMHTTDVAIIAMGA